MATVRQVMCTRQEGVYPHERITHLGGVDAGQRWIETESNAIYGIENNIQQYYTVSTQNQRVPVIVATRLGRKYLKTVADGERPDNLLSLPSCP